MNIIKDIETLEKMHKLINIESTGNPQELASMLGISRSKLYEIINYLKSENITIEYSRRGLSFHYSDNSEYEIIDLLREKFN
jgi:biotin operon repressor